MKFIPDDIVLYPGGDVYRVVASSPECLLVRRVMTIGAAFAPGDGALWTIGSQGMAHLEHASADLVNLIGAGRSALEDADEYEDD